jgi:hypothetical protein
VTRAGSAFELLRAANPVPEERSRGRRRRRTPLMLAFAAIVLCFLLVAPAVGIDIPPLDFWKAEKAPPKVVQDFETLSEGAPPGMDPGAIPGETRKATFADGQTLWVAPTRHGGFCTLGAGGGGCDKLGTVPLSVGWQADRIPLEEMTRPGDPPTTAFVSISGFIKGKYAESVEVRFADGDAEQLDLAWVSEPIDAGFFYYTIPSERRRAGHEISSVVALDAEGKVVTEDKRAARSAAPPADAVLEKKQAALRLATDRGEVIIWEAPTRYEGRCTWLELGGKETAIAPCVPKGYERQAVLGLSAHRLGAHTILAGSCGYASVEIVHQDGRTRTVSCSGGLILAELGPADLAGHLWAVDSRGRRQQGSGLPLSRLAPRS